MGFKSKNEIAPVIKLKEMESVIAIYNSSKKLDKCDSLLHEFTGENGSNFAMWGTGGLDKQLQGEEGNKVRITYYGKRDATIDGKKCQVHQFDVAVWED